MCGCLCENNCLANAFSLDKTATCLERIKRKMFVCYRRERERERGDKKEVCMLSRREREREREMDAIVEKSLCEG